MTSGFIIKAKHFVLLLLCFIVATAKATVTLPRLISNGMVLQRDQPLHIWGWANEGEQVTIAFNGQTWSVKTNADKKWRIDLPAQKAGGPYTMVITGDNTIEITNILVGEVWLCSGQSNMEFIMGRLTDKYPDVIAAATNPFIRQFKVERDWKFSPVADVKSEGWQAADPKTVLKFTSVGYFFALDFYKKYKVPVGLINSTVGGTPAEAWVSEAGLSSFPDLLQQAAKYKDTAAIARIQAADQQLKDNWYAQVAKADQGNNEAIKWYDTRYDHHQWASMNMPASWENNGLKNLDGVVWFEKQIVITKQQAGQPATLFLGNILEQDSTWIDGKLAGTTTDKHTARKYKLPAGMLSEGTHTIVIRITNLQGPGGFVMDKRYYLQIGNETISLEGAWRYKAGASVAPFPANSLTRFNFQPTSLYNTMIAPLVPYAIKGVLWYQGEANAERAVVYRRLFPALINDWRARWNQQHFPFLFVQLPNFKQAVKEPGESDWAELREAQAMTLTLPETGMAVTIDIGEWNDVHPLNKRDVGRRLFLAAEHAVYGNNDVVYTGPVYRSMQKEGNKIVLSFSNTGSGLVAKGDTVLQRFAIAGADYQFVWAHAKIEGQKIMVWSDAISDPVAVRYAWADNPSGSNLFNKEGLPAAPFRTDNRERSKK
ncbi:MAG: sialate O-acetylesterase [Chitinophagaceae bacterium]